MFYHRLFRVPRFWDDSSFRSTSHRGLEGFVQDLLEPNRIPATYGICRRRFRLAGIHGGLAKGAGLEPTQACALLAVLKTAALPIRLTPPYKGMASGGLHRRGIRDSPDQRRHAL